MQAHPHMIHPPKHLILLAFALLTVLLSPQSPAAPPTEPDNHITATLQASTNPVPGQPFILALTLTIEEGWHTYWPGINDTGYGISLTFDPVPGLTFNDPVFPTPKRHIAPGNILDHIYENQITIYIPAQLDDTFAPGDQLTINTTIDYLICKELCIPESATASAALKVADSNDPNPHTKFLAKLANKHPTNLTNASPRWSISQLQLSIPNATHYIFYPDNNCTNPADLITQGDTESHALTITFDRRYEVDPTTPAVLSGRLRAKINDTWHDYDIDYTQPTRTETTP